MATEERVIRDLDFVTCELPNDLLTREKIIRNDEKLEYLRIVADHFFPDYEWGIYIEREGFPGTDEEYDKEFKKAIIQPSIIPTRFSNRFLEREVDNSRAKKYLENEDLQRTLQAFGLDYEKFWYLCLGMADFTNIQVNKANYILPSIKEEIEKLTTYFDEGINSTTGQETKVTIKMDNQKGTVTLTLLDTIKFINELLNESEVNSIGRKIDLKNTTNYPASYGIAVYTKYLYYFLEPLKANRRIHASYDKYFLISQMIHITGLSNDENYLKEYKDNGDKYKFLQGQISKYKDLTLPRPYFY